MRVAIVSDIHGNLTALEAVVVDLRQASPDLTLHGGDLADCGSRPIEVLDCIRDLGWPGVIGNTDEMLAMPDTLANIARQKPDFEALWSVLREMAAWTRDALGDERLRWLAELPRMQIQDGSALVHGCPESPWRSPGVASTDEELASIYGCLNQPLVVYAHIHHPYIRRLERQKMLIANTGSVGLSYDGESRASYLVIDESGPAIRRVEYALDRELRALSNSGLPHSAWIARTLQSASPQMP